MKKAILAVPFAILAGCTSVVDRYYDAGLGDYTMYDIWIQLGFKDPWFPSEYKDININSIPDKDYLKSIAYSSNRGDINKNDFVKLSDAARNISSVYHDYLFEDPMRDGLPMPDLLPALENVHKGVDPEKVVNSLNVTIHHEINKYEEHEKEMEKLEEKTQDNTYGKELVKKCGGYGSIQEMPPMNPIVDGSVGDPYAYVGKCIHGLVSASLYTAEGARSTIQWLSPNAVLVIPRARVFPYNMMPLPRIFVSSAHIQLENNFVAVGIRPSQYESQSGKLETPMTFQIIKYY